MAANTPFTSGVYASVATPGGVVDPAQILTLQQPYNAPQSLLTEIITNGLNIPPLLDSRFSNFSDAIYSLNPTDHIVRFLKVLLGEAGSGQYRNRAIAARLQSLLSGGHFYQLDSFYGEIFGLTRTSNEQFVSISPYTDLGTYDQWGSVRTQDAYYRNRIERFAKAISLGATVPGIQAIAEALLQSSVQVIEMGQTGILTYKTWDYLEAHGGTTTPSLGGVTWADVQWQDTGHSVVATYASLEKTNTISGNYKSFIVQPGRLITPEEELALRIVIDVFKPADTTYTIQAYLQDTDTPITPRGVYADSSYWHLVESIIPNPRYASLYQLSDTPDANGFREILRPAYSEYQGEEINYNNDISNIASGVNPNLSVDPTAPNYAELTLANETDYVVFYDGSGRAYPPELALATKMNYLGGRVVNTAILQSNSFSTDLTNASHQSIYSTTGTVTINDPTKADSLALYVDGVNLHDLTNIVKQQSATDRNDLEVFWATPKRAADDATVEGLEIRFNAPKTINSLTFDNSHFPHNFQVWALDADTGVWVRVVDNTIYDSVPAVLPIAPPMLDHHDQHFGNAHWSHNTASFPAITTSRLQIRMVRINTGTPPVKQNRTAMSGVNNISAVPAPYSLGLRNLSVNYTVTKQSDLPLSPLFTTDALGSRVEWSVRQETSDRAISGQVDAWRSAPQPSSDSVVNFYLDARDGSGNAQVIDKFFIDPLYTGPHISLYYSNDDTANLGVSAEYTEFVPPLSTITNIEAISTGLVTSSTQPSYATIQNVAMQWQADSAWWMGFYIHPNFSSANAAGQIIFDSGADLSLTLDAPAVGSSVAILTLNAPGGLSATYPVTFQANDDLYIAVVFSTDDYAEYAPGLHLFAGVNSLPYGFVQQGFTNMVHPEPFPVLNETPLDNYIPVDAATSQQPINLYLGGAPYSAIPSNLNLSNFILKQESAQAEMLEEFVENPHEYCVTSEYDEGIPGLTTANSIVRFDPSFVTPSNPAGMVGGPGDFYPMLNWTPIPRDYTASKGYMHFLPTLAKFWKLEFTNLSPQPISMFSPIQRRVRTHQSLSPNIVQAPKPISASNPGEGPVGAKLIIPYTNQSTSTSLTFTDRTFIKSTVPNPNATPPTATSTVIDMALRQQQAKRAWWWRYQKGAYDLYAPTFVRQGMHNYNEVDLFHDAQVGYFAGLNEIVPYRTIGFLGADDSIFDEFFLDTAGLSSSHWNRNPGDLNTIGLTPAVTETSKVLPSANPVVGLHFATSQSDSVQLAFDDQFRSGYIRSTNFSWSDPSLPNNIGFIDDSGHWVTKGDASLNLNKSANTVTVQRFKNYQAVPAASDMVQPIPSDIYSPIITVTTGTGSGASTSMNVADTGGFAGAGSISVPSNVGTLTFNYTGITPTSFTGLSLASGASGDTWAANALVTQAGASGSNYGGLATSWISPVNPPAAWTAPNRYGPNTNLWAAVRVTVNQTLTEPLVLEIVDAGSSPAFNTTVLASLEFTPAPGQMTEKFIGWKAPSVVSNPIYARIVQYGSTDDVFTVNRLSLYDEGIFWEFSKNGGADWIRPSSEIRNNANGLLSFPDYKFLSSSSTGLNIETGSATFTIGTKLSYKPGNPVYLSNTAGHGTLSGVVVSYNPATGVMVADITETTGTTGSGPWTSWTVDNPGGDQTTSIRWRVTATRPDMHVNGLRIRPTYAVALVGSPQGIIRGPNLNFFEHQPPIAVDPMFNGWIGPIPYSWYAAAINYPVGNTGDIPAPNEFTKSYTREAVDNLSFSDTATGNYKYPSTTRAAAPLSLTYGDGVARAHGVFHRNYTNGLVETLSFSDTATAIKIALPPTSDMVAPIDHPI